MYIIVIIYVITDFCNLRFTYKLNCKLNCRKNEETILQFPHSLRKLLRIFALDLMKARTKEKRRACSDEQFLASQKILQDIYFLPLIFPSLTNTLKQFHENQIEFFKLINKQQKFIKVKQIRYKTSVEVQFDFRYYLLRNLSVQIIAFTMILIVQLYNTLTYLNFIILFTENNWNSLITIYFYSYTPIFDLKYSAIQHIPMTQLTSPYIFTRNLNL